MWFWRVRSYFWWLNFKIPSRSFWRLPADVKNPCTPNSRLNTPKIRVLNIIDPNLKATGSTIV